MKKERKGILTFEEKIRAAYLHYCEDIDQHVIAVAFGVNQGRINEACKAVKSALSHRDRSNGGVGEVAHDG